MAHHQGTQINLVAALQTPNVGGVFMHSTPGLQHTCFYICSILHTHACTHRHAHPSRDMQLSSPIAV